MPRRMVGAVLLAGLLPSGGCTFAQGVVAESLGVPLQNKAVAVKRGSQELIAADGTSCFVSRGRFEEVEVGDGVTCSWSTEPRRDAP